MIEKKVFEKMQKVLKCCKKYCRNATFVADSNGCGVRCSRGELLYRRNAMFRRAFYALLYYTMLFLYNIMAEQPASDSIEGYSNTAFKPPALPILPLIIRLYTCTPVFSRCCTACYVRLKL